MRISFHHAADYAHEAATVAQLIILGGSPSAAFGA
jgi:hypothetical protein